METGGLINALLNKAHEDQEFFLDLLDAALFLWRNQWQQRQVLEEILAIGGSVWTVSNETNPPRLVRVVEPAAEEAYRQAIGARDEASKELGEAWSHAFGRGGSASDAWDHAIKAVEDILIAVVCPKKAKATLGDVLGQLNSVAAIWEFVLPGPDRTHDVSQLVTLLRIVWPNPDRHGGTQPKREPTIEEARAVVTLAATIVQWHRSGWVVRKR